MDIEEFVVPVPFDVKPEKNSDYQIIDGVSFFDYDEIDHQSIVICGLTDAVYSAEFDVHYQNIRNHFYRLSKSNWQKKIYDIGTIFQGHSFEDTCFAVHQIVKKVNEKGALLIMLGGSQAFSYIVYQGIQKDLMKVGTIDIKLDIEGNTERLSSENHITNMILNEDFRLLSYFNLGSQAPYVAKEELDIVEQLNFENIRLGKLNTDLSIAEPYLRELDFLSVDMNAMQYLNFTGIQKITPNGFNAREICGLMRYAGLNKNLKAIHINNFNSVLNLNDSALLAEMLWYFIEANNNQKSDHDIQTYRVQIQDDEEIVFFKSNGSERWWIQVEIDKQLSRIPCNYQDYKEALNGDYPDIWLKVYKKFY